MIEYENGLLKKFYKEIGVTIASKVKDEKDIPDTLRMMDEQAERISKQCQSLTEVKKKL